MHFSNAIIYRGEALRARFCALYNQTFDGPPPTGRLVERGVGGRFFAVIDRGSRVPHHGVSCFRKSDHSRPLP